MNRVLRGFAICVFSILHTAPAQTVHVRAGNIYLQIPGGGERQVTVSGRDTDAVLSPDLKKILFVRVIRDSPDASGLGRVVEQSEIDCVDVLDPKYLVRQLVDMPVEARGQRFSWFSSPRYSPDGSYVYFVVPDYSTVSPGLFSLEVRDGQIRFLTQALRFWVLSAGPYRNDLIVWQNPMFVGGGRYDVFNLIEPSGGLLGVVGFNEASVRRFLTEFGSTR